MAQDLRLLIGLLLVAVMEMMEMYIGLHEKVMFVVVKVVVVLVVKVLLGGLV